MKKLLFFGLLVLALAIKIFYLPNCQWVITNCCPETAGASWECVDVKTFEKPNCTEILVLCPQVLSPKPNKSCVYEPFEGCVAK